MADDRNKENPASATGLDAATDEHLRRIHAQLTGFLRGGMAYLVPAEDATEPALDIADLVATIEHLRGDVTAGPVGSETTGARDCRLVLQDEAGVGTEFLLEAGDQTIGRSVRNDIVLRFPSVSRRHALVSRSGGRTRIVDYDSKNGVRVNGQRVSQRDLRPGDVVHIGEIELHYSESD